MIKLPRFEHFVWIGLAAYAGYYFDVVNAVRFDHRIYSAALIAAVCLASVTVLIAAYFIIWCSYVKSMSSDDWEVHQPYFIPIATLSFILASIGMNCALWGVYGVKTPFLLFVLGMGTVSTIALVPSWEAAKEADAKHK